LRAISESVRCARFADAVGEVGVDPVDDGAVREIAVAAERQLAQHEVAHRVDAVLLGELGRRHHVLQPLRHLLALDRPPAMGEDPARRRDPGGHQEGRPVDRVEAQDVLADHVQIRRPEGAELLALGVRIAGGGDVVGQRVEPDIHDMRRIARHRDAPAEAGARHREVAQPRLDERDDLVRRALGAMKSGWSS